MTRSTSSPLALTFALVLMVAGTAAARAQTYRNPDLPRSPYALPTPTYREPDVGDVLVNGNGELHASGQWRHWGDDRNGGETFQELFAPNGVLGGGESPRYREYARRDRLCNFHPGAC